MTYRLFAMARPLMLAAMLIASLATLTPTGVSAQNDRGLIDDTSYQSPQFGYSITWADPWSTQDRDVITNPGGFDTITLRSDEGTVRISGRADDYDPVTFLQDTVAVQLASGGELIDQDTAGAVPTAELLIGNDRMRLDVISIPDSNAVVLVSLRAGEASFPTVLASAQETIQVNGNPVFSAADTASTTTVPADLTGAATPAAEGEDAPTASEAPPASTVEVMGGGIEGSSYTSPNFGFSISWDPAVWSVPEEAEYSEPDYDSLTLDSATGPIWVTGWNAYNGNPSTCLLGEQTYYNDPEFGISEWQVAVDENGNELTGESETSAWGVFTNVYTDPDDPAAEPENFVDYIECVSLGDGESVVIFYSYASRENYNAHIENVLALIESLELPEPTAATPTATDVVLDVTPTEAPTIPATAAVETPQSTVAAETPVATTPAETPPATTSTSATQNSTPTDLTGGDEVTGQTYAYRFTVPAGWQVTETILGGDIERSVLTNGTSTVGVVARALPVNTLSDCVTNVAGEDASAPIYTDLELATTASGDPFSGEDEFSAFANFTFTGPDGETWAHFVECRWIVEGESVLVVTQDVPQELFGSERAARRQIQNTIEVGP